MSTLEVNTINPQSGTTITIGGSGDTVTLGSGATQSGFGGVNTPAFSAYMSGNQSITHEVYTKANFDTQIFDTDGAYDEATNYRFTVPSGEGGKYFFYTNLVLDAIGAANLQNCQIAFYKNGSEFKKNSWNFNSNDIYYAGMQLSSVMNLSASDYIEVYARISDASGTPRINATSTLSEFSGYKLIGA